MGYLAEMLHEERNRLIQAQQMYNEKLSHVPKGKIVYKSINGQKYPYLLFRENGKVKTIYIKKHDLSKIESAIKERNNLKKILHNIKENLYTIEHGIGAI